MSGVRVEFAPSGKPVKHGGAGTSYSHYGCRCEECTAAHRARMYRRQKARRVEDAPAGSHGSASTYDNWHCRCAPCRAAKAVSNKAQYESRKSRAH